ncbi:chitin-binding domain protein cbd-1-like [Glandiceps talaboti]
MPYQDKYSGHAGQQHVEETMTIRLKLPTYVAHAALLKSSVKTKFRVNPPDHVTPWSEVAARGRIASEFFQMPPPPLVTNTPVGKVDCSTAPAGLYPYPSDCTKYINCGSGMEFVQSCPPGTVFNPRQLYCDWPENVPECDETLNSPTTVKLGQSTASAPVTHSPVTNTPVSKVDCSTAPAGLYPYPSDCTKYINCGSGMEFVQSCPPGTVFNPRQLYCDWPENVPECDETLPSPTTVKPEQTSSPTTMESKQTSSPTTVESDLQTSPQPTTVASEQSTDGVPVTQQLPVTNTPVGKVDCSTAPAGLYPYPSDCTKFINCGSGMEFVQSCPPGTVFNPRQLYCDWPANVPECDETLPSPTTVKSGQSTASAPVTHSPVTNTPVSKVDCTTAPAGLYPYPSDCTKFINCGSGMEFVQSCPPGTVFNPRQLYCDWPANVPECDESLPSPTTVKPEQTSSPTTVESGQTSLPTTMKSDHQTSLQPTTVTSEQSTDSVPVTQQLPVTNTPVGKVDCSTAPAGLYPYPSDCTKFINCGSGMEFVQSCPPGTVFNPRQLYCDWPENVPECDETLNSPTTVKLGQSTASAPVTHSPVTNTPVSKVDCTTAPAGLYPYPSDCTKFINCGSGMEFVQSCPPGTVFNPRQLYCDWPANVPECDETLPSPTTVKPEQTSSPTTVESEQTSSPTTVDSDLQTSPQPTTVASEQSTDGVPVTQQLPVTNTPVGKVDCSTAPAGLYPYPSDCTKFINCGSGMEFVQSCPPGTVFNPRQLYCDWPENVPECDETLNSPTTVKLGQSTASAPVTHSPVTNTPVSKVDCSTAPAGLYPYPLDCTKYINCGSGMEFVQSCPPGTVFNPRQLYCDWPANVPECDETLP